jgi:hypothetical protein
MNKVHKLVFESGTKTYDIPEGYEVKSVVHSDINSIILILRKDRLFIKDNNIILDINEEGDCCGNFAV